MTAEKLVKKMQRITRNQPTTRKASLQFVRQWAFGNAGIENPSITEEVVERAIQEPKRKRTA